MGSKSGEVSMHGQEDHEAEPSELFHIVH